MTEPSTDTALWSQLRQGNEKALYALHQQWYQDLLHYGLRRCGNTEDTKEAINAVFAGLWVNREKLPAVTHPKAYLFTCLKNKLLRSWQQARARPTLQVITDDLLLSTASVEETLIEMQEHQALRRQTAQLLRQLTARQQELLQLRFIEELSYEEIAGRLNITVRTVYNSIHESLRALRDAVDNNGS